MLVFTGSVTEAASSPGIAPWSCAMRFVLGIDSTRFPCCCGTYQPTLSLISRLDRPAPGDEAGHTHRTGWFWHTNFFTYVDFTSPAPTFRRGCKANKSEKIGVTRTTQFYVCGEARGKQCVFSTVHILWPYSFKRKTMAPARPKNSGGNNEGNIEASVGTIFN